MSSFNFNPHAVNFAAVNNAQNQQQHQQNLQQAPLQLMQQNPHFGIPNPVQHHNATLPATITPQQINININNNNNNNHLGMTMPMQSTLQPQLNHSLPFGLMNTSMVNHNNNMNIPLGMHVNNSNTPNLIRQNNSNTPAGQQNIPNIQNLNNPNTSMFIRHNNSALAITNPNTPHFMNQAVQSAGQQQASAIGTPVSTTNNNHPNNNNNITSINNINNIPMNNNNNTQITNTKSPITTQINPSSSNNILNPSSINTSINHLNGFSSLQVPSSLNVNAHPTNGGLQAPSGVGVLPNNCQGFIPTVVPTENGQYTINWSKPTSSLNPITDPLNHQHLLLQQQKVQLSMQLQQQGQIKGTLSGSSSLSMSQASNPSQQQPTVFQSLVNAGPTAGFIQPLSPSLSQQKVFLDPSLLNYPITIKSPQQQQQIDGAQPQSNKQQSSAGQPINISLLQQQQPQQNSQQVQLLLQQQQQQRQQQQGQQLKSKEQFQPPQPLLTPNTIIQPSVLPTQYTTNGLQQQHHHLQQQQQHGVNPMITATSLISPQQPNHPNISNTPSNQSLPPTQSTASQITTPNQAHLTILTQTGSNSSMGLNSNGTPFIPPVEERVVIAPWSPPSMFLDKNAPCPLGPNPSLDFSAQTTQLVDLKYYSSAQLIYRLTVLREQLAQWNAILVAQHAAKSDIITDDEGNEFSVATLAAAYDQLQVMFLNVYFAIVLSPNVSQSSDEEFNIDIPLPGSDLKTKLFLQHLVRSGDRAPLLSGGLIAPLNPVEITARSGHITQQTLDKLVQRITHSGVIEKNKKTETLDYLMRCTFANPHGFTQKQIENVNKVPRPWSRRREVWDCCNERLASKAKSDKKIDSLVDELNTRWLHNRLPDRGPRGNITLNGEVYRSHRRVWDETMTQAPSSCSPDGSPIPLYEGSIDDSVCWVRGTKNKTVRYITLTEYRTEITSAYNLAQQMFPFKRQYSEDVEENRKLGVEELTVMMEQDFSPVTAIKRSFAEIEMFAATVPQQDDDVGNNVVVRNDVIDALDGFDDGFVAGSNTTTTTNMRTSTTEDTPSNPDTITSDVDCTLNSNNNDIIPSNQSSLNNNNNSSPCEQQQHATKRQRMRMNDAHDDKVDVNQEVSLVQSTATAETRD